MSLAIAVSVALHTAIILAVHPSRGAARPQGFAFTARLVPALVPALVPEDERRDQAATLHERSLSPPANAAVRPTQEAPVAGPPQDPASLTGLPVPRYYPASELQQQPAPLQPVEPENPVESGSREGFVQLRLLISERGSVDAVEVVRAEPSGVFEKSALAAFANARFSPGMRFGVAVKSQLLVEVQYRLDNRAVSGRGY